MGGHQPDQPQPRAGHLPLQPTPFVGRRQELESVAALLSAPGCRLLTLVGPGGIGKTRLALEVAATLGDQYADGTYLAELDAVTDPALVDRAAASALGVRDQPGQSALETLSAALQQKKVLLILDNCEHLLDACAELAHGLLTTCPELSLLATSREPLRTAGEVIWEVPPLSLPEPEGQPAVADLQAMDAVALFVDRARRALPAFELSRENAPQVVRLCRRLDGLPLAIELAAARIRVLSPEQIYERLDDALRLLAGGDRLAPARQQTLRAALDWSYDLLTTDERFLFQRLSVFAGTFSLEAAEEICSGDGLEPDTILDLLSSLVDRSLVFAGRSEGRSHRFRLLDTIQAYADERLAATGNADQWRDRHLYWYLDFAEEADPTDWGSGDVRTLQRLDLEHGNLRRAMQWTIESGRAEKGHRLAVALSWLWHRRGHLHEGRHWLDQILAEPGDVPPQVRIGALETAGALAAVSGDHQQAGTLHQEAVALGRVHGSSIYVAYSLAGLALLAFDLSDYERGDARLAESLEMFCEIGAETGVGWALVVQGYQAHRRGDRQRAESALRVSLHFLRQQGTTYMLALSGLASVAKQRGELRAATAYVHEALRVATEQGYPLAELTHCLEDLANLAAAQALPERAASLLGAARTLRQTTGLEALSFHRSKVEQTILTARSRLGAAAFEAAFATGRQMTVDQAVAYALESTYGETTGIEGDGSTPSTPKLTPLQAEKAKFGGLTARERQVAALVAGGKSNRAIAEELVVTLRTAEAHVTHILRKLGFDSRAQIAAWAVDRGLADPPETLEEQLRGS